MSWIPLASYVGVAGMALFALAAIVLHFLPTGLNPLRSSVGEYATGKFGYLSAIGFVGAGLGSLVLDAGIAAGLKEGKRVWIGVVLAAVWALGLFAAAFLRPDAEGAPRTSSGKLHGVTTVASFAAMVLTTIVISPVFVRVHAWIHVAPLLRRLEIAVVVLAVLLLVARIKALRVAYGLVERLFYVSSLSWLIVLGIHLARIRH